MNVILHKKRSRRNERGQILAVVGVFLAAGTLAGMAVLAIDIARLSHAGSEAQLIADASSTAGETAMLAALGAGQDAAQARNAAKADARSVAQPNLNTGETLALDTVTDCFSYSPEIGTVCVSVHPGNYDTAAKLFTRYEDNPNLTLNAVQTRVRKRVSNIVAGIWGNFDSTVNRFATAGVRTVDTGSPDAPIMIGECCGGSANCVPEEIDCANPVSITMDIPDGTQNAGWTDWASTVHSIDDSNVYPFFKNTWCAANVPTHAGCSNTDVHCDEKKTSPGCCGGGQTPSVTVGDQVNMQESQGGVKTPPWILADAVLQGDDTFVVPVTDCPEKRTNKSLATITSFATIKIDAVQLRSDICAKTWDTKRFTITFLCNSQEPPGPGGDTAYGTGMAVLFE